MFLDTERQSAETVCQQKMRETVLVCQQKMRESETISAETVCQHKMRADRIRWYECMSLLGYCEESKPPDRAGQCCVVSIVVRRAPRIFMCNSYPCMYVAKHLWLWTRFTSADYSRNLYEERISYFYFLLRHFKATESLDKAGQWSVFSKSVQRAYP